MVRKIEQGKTYLNKVNLVLQMFGHELAPVNSKTILERGISGLDHNHFSEIQPLNNHFSEEIIIFHGKA